MEKYFVKVEEARLKSATTRKMNKLAKDKKERAARLSTEEGKEKALAYIFSK